jgi:hypothetical protein
MIAEKAIIDYPGKLHYLIVGFFMRMGEGAIFFLWAAEIIFITALIFLVFAGFDRNASGAGKWYKRFLYSDIFFLLVIYTGILILRAPNLIVPRGSFDESQWITGAATLLKNPKIFESVIPYTSGPLVFLPIVIINFMGGGLNCVSTRLSALLCCILPSITFMYLAFVNLFSARIARIAIFPVILCMALINHPQLYGYTTEQMAMSLTSVSLFLYVKTIPDSKNKYFYLLTLGFILGCLPLVKWQAAPIAAAIGIMCCITIFSANRSGPGAKIKELACFGLSCLLPICIFFLYLYVTHTVEEFRQSIIFILSYTRAGVILDEINIKINSIQFLFKKFNWIFFAPDVFGYYFKSLFFVDYIIGFFVVKSWKYLTQRMRYLIVSSFILLLGGLSSIIIPKESFEHYFFLLIMPLLFFTGILMASVYEYRPLEFEMAVQRLNKPKIIAILITAISLFGYSELIYPNRGIEIIKDLKKSRIDFFLSPVARKIKEYACPNERMVVWGWANFFYVETGLLQGTRYCINYNQVIKNNQQDYYLRTYASDLIRNKPVVFVDVMASCADIFFRNVENRYENFPLIRNIVDNYYTFVADICGIRIYIRKDRIVQLETSRESLKCK